MKDDFVDEFFLVKYIILPQLIFSVSVTDVKCRPVLHLCVVFFSGPQGSCNFCCCLRLGGKGASEVWHLSLYLMNNFNKTKAAIFHTQVVLPEGFSFYSVEYKSYRDNYYRDLQLFNIIL